MRRPLVLLAAAAAALFVLGPAQGGAFPGVNGDIGFGCGSNICITPADGSASGVLISNAFEPQWSADGTKIAFVRGNDVYTANADGTSQTQFPGTDIDQPTWAPDNSTLAYVKSDGTYDQIYSRNSLGNETELTTSLGDSEDPEYSPDGTQIAYSMTPTSQTSAIYVESIGTPSRPSRGTPVQIVNDGNGDYGVDWSPDGSKLLYLSGTELETVTVAAPHTVADLGVTALAAAYSPDGTQIAYVSLTGQLYLMPATGGTSRQIATTQSSIVTVDWGQATTTSSTGSGNAPANTSYPTVFYASGDSSPVVGHALVANVGSWTGNFPITYAYQWKRCDPGDPLNGACYDISGATSSFYTPVQVDFGYRIRVAVTATNSGGSTSQNSESTAPVTAIAAKVTSTPQITPGGTNQVDQLLTLTPGTWAGSTPITFTYTWERCDPQGDLSSCVAIPGATASSYTPTTADIGFALRVWIVGSNFVGSDTAITNHTFPIVDKPHFPPSAATPPTVSPTPAYGLPATATVGAYLGDNPITTVLRWWRCDATGADCHAIPKVTKLTYTPGSKDIGYTLRVSVTATNAYGTLVAQSDPSEPIAAPPPHRKGKRVVATKNQMYVAGTKGDDVIVGNRRNDTILGNGGYDVIRAGSGNDVIHVPGPGNSRVDAGAGSDTIYAANGYRDVIDCGAGNDRAYVDPFDVVSKDCEVVTVVQPAGSGTGSGSGSGSGTGSGSGSGSGSGLGSP